MASIETNSEGYGTDPEEATTNTIFKYNEEITEPPEEGLVTPGAALLSSQMEQLEENISPGQPKTGDNHFQMVGITSDELAGGNESAETFLRTSSGMLEGEDKGDQNTGLFDDTQVLESNEPYERSAWSRADLDDVREQGSGEYTQYNENNDYANFETNHHFEKNSILCQFHLKHN